ncbi:uncharacterized protein LOC128652890 [Bombina bombina]|uniref:uncharacterized protein LOC128652890 n=1 Tax=Bombina bombina TaxID=8345 RepID=UPI00235A4B8B|nr:uncharacterized protein LOC128652890 [Bombina bombina]
MPANRIVFYGLAISLLLICLCLPAETGSEHEVKCENTTAAHIGANVTLKCDFLSSYDVLQVTWQKQTKDVLENMATCSRKYGVKIVSPFDKRILVKSTSTHRSTMIIFDLKKEDETCYFCLFNSYRYGAYKGQVCITLQGDQTPNNQIKCSATGKHPPSISLQPPENEEGSVKETMDNKDGTSTVTRKTEYTDSQQKIYCDFSLQNGDRKRRDLKEGNNLSTKISDEMITQCSVSGTANPKIIWMNEGKPSIKEDKVVIEDNMITVTSVRKYSSGSFLNSVTLSCVVLTNTEKEDSSARHAACQDTPNIIRLAIVSGVFCVMLILGTALFCYQKWKRKGKSFLNGIITPIKENRKSHSSRNNTQSPDQLSSKPLREGFNKKEETSNEKENMSFGFQDRPNTPNNRTDVKLHIPRQDFKTPENIHNNSLPGSEVLRRKNSAKKKDGKKPTPKKNLSFENM